MSHQYDSLWQRGWALSSLPGGSARTSRRSRYNSSSLERLAYETPRNRPTDTAHPTHHRLRAAQRPRTSPRCHASTPVHVHSSDQLIQFFRPTEHLLRTKTCRGTWRSFAGEKMRFIPYDGLSPSSSPERSRSSLDPTLPSPHAPVRIEASSALPTERSPTDSYPRIPSFLKLLEQSLTWCCFLH